MNDIYTVLYTPRSDEDSIADLKANGLNDEFREQLQIIDADAVPIELISIINEIIDKLLTANNLDKSIYFPEVYISGENNINASMISCAKTPILVLTKGLLEKVTHEDELAAVIAHELGHLIIHELVPDKEQQTKVDEVEADQWGVKLLYEAKYNPRALNFFLTHIAGGHSHAVNLDDIKQAESLEKGLQLIRGLADPHPCEDNRIRAMEMHIATLMRQQGANIHDHMQELGDRLTQYTSSLAYQTPITRALETINYESMCTIDKLNVLTTLLTKMFIPTNEVDGERLNEIPAKIATLQVNFSIPEEAEAFNCLADTIMSWEQLKNKSNRQIRPKWRKWSYEENIMPAMIKVWQAGGKDSNYFARNEDLKTAIDAFVNAGNKTDAENAAKRILDCYDRIHLTRQSSFNWFDVPNIADIPNLQAWTPPYSQHVLWCQEQESTNIKRVLCLMNIDRDPWAQSTIGQAEPDENRCPFRKHPIDIRPWKTLERDATGKIVAQIVPIPPFNWPFLAHDAQPYQITQLHNTANIEKAQYEQNILASVSWDLLQSDFTKFILKYGQMLQHSYSVTPINCPFAESFYAHLLELLPTEDEKFKLQLQDFFYSYLDDKQYRDDTVYRLEDLHSSQNLWPYRAVEKPKYHSMNHPLILFVLNKKSWDVVTDRTRLQQVLYIEDFIKPDTHLKLCEKFAIPPSEFLATYPHNIQTINDLTKATTISFISDITLAIEAERLAYTFQDTIDLKEYMILKRHLTNISGNYNGKVNSAMLNSSAPSFFKDLLTKVLTRTFDSDDLEYLIENYRYAQGYNLLLEYPEIVSDLNKKIQNLLEQKPIKERIYYLKLLLAPKSYEQGSIVRQTLPANYDGFITAPQFRSWVINQLTDDLALDYGQDEGDTAYEAQIKGVIDDICANTQGIIQQNILVALAYKINAQKSLCTYFKDMHQGNMQELALKQKYESILLELFINQSNKDATLRHLILDFLRNPLTPSSSDSLTQYISNKKYLEYNITESSLNLLLQIFHQNFRASSLEMKTMYLNPILFPTNTNKQEQLAIIQNILDEIFPLNHWDAKIQEQNQIAQSILSSYINIAEPEDRILITTALYVSNLRDHATQEIRVGEKLNIILSNMGPAGGKLLQAIHSYPDTPEDIRADLAQAKTMFSPPKRWELVDLVDKAGLLVKSDDNPNPVINIGEIKGSGSFGITVFNTLQDGTRVADTFLRPFAIETANREFSNMEAATQTFIAQRPDFAPLIPILQEAKESAAIETNMDLAAEANTKAEQSYNNLLVRVGTKILINDVTELYQTGQNYKRVRIAEGVHFNDLSTNDKKPIAKAIIATQLYLRLHGFNTDLDRHGGNIKIQGSVITHFDFGAMNTTTISDDDKYITGIILAQSVIATYHGQDFSNAFLENLQKAEVSTETRKYLSGLNKDFLALGDYLHCLNSEERASLIAKCLNDVTIDPMIRDAFNKELGYYRYLIKRGLKSKAHNAAVQIYHCPIDKMKTAEFMQGLLDGDVNKVGSMLEQGFDCRPTNCPHAFELAIESRCFDMVHWLLEKPEWLSDINTSSFLKEHKHNATVKHFNKLITLKLHSDRLDERDYNNNVNLLRAEYEIKFASHSKDNELSYDDVAPDYASLFQCIKELQTYGEELNEHGYNKGLKAINLAQSLNRELRSYIQNPENRDVAAQHISALIIKGKSIMRQDRRALDIIAHIVLAMTGIGLIVMLGHKAYTGTFFLNPTRREGLLDAVAKDDNIPKP